MYESKTHSPAEFKKRTTEIAPIQQELINSVYLNWSNNPINLNDCETSWSL